MTPCTERLRLHLPILPLAKVEACLRGSNRCSTTGGMIYTRRKHGITFAAAEKSLKDLCFDEDHGTLLSYQRKVEESELATSTLYSLESTISEHKAELGQPGSGKPSWTKKLLLSSDLLCKKIREEADELCRTLEDNEDKSRTVSEMAHVLYHSMVLLTVQDVKMEAVLEIHRQSFSESGIEEEQSRPRN